LDVGEGEGYGVFSGPAGIHTAAGQKPQLSIWCHTAPRL
jgi:hypothetical protein